MALIIATVTILVMAMLCISGRKYVDRLPSVIIAIGILGTVTGIVTVLNARLLSDIAGNAPELINTLKINFAPVIVALFIAITIKLSRIFSNKAATHPKDGSTLDDLAGLLSDISQTQKIFYNESNNKLRLIYQSLAGDDDNTVSSHIRTLRQSFSDKLDDLIHEFSSLVERMSENHSRVMSESRKDLVTSFDANMKKHLTSSFEHFNEAIDKLIQWHENYRDQVEKMVMELYASVVIIKECERSLSASTKKSDSYQKTVDSLKTLITDMQHDTEMINSQIEFVDAFVNKIRNSLPQQNQSLRQL